MKKILKLEFIIVSIILLIGSVGSYHLYKNDHHKLESSYEEAIVYLGMHVNKLLEDGDLITLNRIIKSIKHVRVAVFENDNELIATNFNKKIYIQEFKSKYINNYNRFYRSPIYQDGKLAAQVFILQPTFFSLYWKKYLLVSAFFILILATLFLWLKKQKDVQDIKYIADYLSNDQIENLNIEMSSYNRYLYNQLVSYRHKILQLSDKLKEQTEIETKALISKQVAHDIRSPLAALNMISKDFDELPESTRLMLRSSVNRIQDIANNLLSPIGKDQTSKLDSTFDHLLSPLIEEVISEKRTELRSFPNINIDINTNESYGIFVNVNQSHMKRVISNVLNNSVDSFYNHSGEVIIKFKKVNNNIKIIITDNGRGIPSEIIPELFQKGATFGKSDKGSGLGLFHAKNTLEKWNAQISINSDTNIGTDVIITLPIAKAPDWFISEIPLTPNQTIVIVDDDSSIHQIWKKRLSSYEDNYTINTIHLSSPEQVDEWISNNTTINSTFLFDFEFINYEINGIDIIEKHSLFNNSILVTSRYEDKIVKDRCLKNKIKMIPKMMSEIAPIKIYNHQQYDLIHLDDDELIRLSWQLSAKKMGKTILSFSSAETLLENIHSLPKDIPFYIDSYLGENCLRGEEIAKVLNNLGHKELYLTTGYVKDDFEGMHWVKGVVGKRAPFCENFN